MAERIVVRISTPSKTGTGDDSFVERAQLLLRRAKALGASLCAWDWQGFCFAFEVEDFEEAVSFVTGPDATRLLAGLRVAVCQGELVTVLTDGELELGWGAVMRRAALLTRMASPGEVLLDSDMLAMRSAALMTSGTRISPEDSRVQGTLIGTEDPWRQATDRAVERIVQPSLIGRDEAMRALEVSPGTLATIRAEPGLGGTRLLLAYGETVAPTSTLMLKPAGQAMEPLGALRLALGRQVALQRAPALEAPHAATLQTLLAGRGCALDDAAELLEAWLAGPDCSGNGALLIDDAIEIDIATLEVVATSLLGAAHAFRVVARLDASFPLPATLALLPPGPEVDLAPLAPSDAARLADAWLEGKLGAEAALLWAERAGRVPLALSEALLEGLTSGDLRLLDDLAQNRSVASPPRIAIPAAAWVQRRLRRLAPSARALLFAVAVLGGDAAVELVAALLDAAADVPTDVHADIAALGDAGWLISVQPGWIALPSRTHRRVLVESVAEPRRAPWHRACSLALETREGNLALAEAAWHAAAAGDRPRAERLAQQAAEIAREVGLEESALHLAAFARAQSPSPRPRTESDVSDLVPRPPLSSYTGKPEDSFPSALVARGPKRPSRFTFPPVALPEPEGASANSMLQAIPRPTSPPAFPDATASTEGPLPYAQAFAGPAAPHPVPPLPRRERPDLLGPPLPGGRPLSLPTLDTSTGLQPVQPPTPDPDAASPLPPPRPRATTIYELTAQDQLEDSPRDTPPQLPEAAEGDDTQDTLLPALGHHALTSGEPPALEAWLAKLVASGRHERLVQRMRAMMALQKSDGIEALGTLRAACEQARTLGPLERARSHLAYAVGLARAGRATDSLVEALEALSRAREASSTDGERACATFLRVLCARTGHQDQAKRWEQLLQSLSC